MTDLFESFDMLPEEVKNALNSFDEDTDLYKECKRVLKLINRLGYTYEYYLDGVPFNLQKIPVCDHFNFEFNECGVCTNPTIVYYYIPKNALAWAYLEITVATYKGKWDFGYSSIGGGCAASKSSMRFGTKEEAIKAAIERIRKCLRKDSKGLGVKTEPYKKHFENWLLSRKQLSLF